MPSKSISSCSKSRLNTFLGFRHFNTHCRFPVSPARIYSHVIFKLHSENLGPIHTMRHTVPSPFHIRSVKMLCVHTVRRVPSPPRTAHDRRPAIVSIKYTAHCHGMHFQLFVKYRVIHKSLRDFRTRLRNNQGRHGRKEHINR